MDLLWCVT